jgi:Holliday junction resolvase RusA-like endonuclease
MEQRFQIFVEPMGKPRMTQRDKWAKRKVVVRYRSYADELRRQTQGIMASPIIVSWRAFFTIPESWSAKKKAALCGELHTSKPDRDNVDKGILDALWEIGRAHV